jgi:hypothetical protein
MAVRRYLLAENAQFRVTGRNEVAVNLEGRQSALSLKGYRALLEFARPLSLTEALARFDTDGRGASLRTALRGFVKSGLLRPVRTSSRRPTTDRMSSIEDVLNTRVWKPAARRALTARLRAGQACVIRNAFNPAFARQVSRQLEAVKSWPAREEFDAFFSFHHHRLSSRADFPPNVLACAELFETDPSKRFIASLSGADCSGPIEFDASLYLPGDQVLPHDDFVRKRTVAYIWYLTRSWSPRWGGQLFWCRSGNSFMPTFNTLVLFRVSRKSLHLVTATSPLARGKRLAISGWWTQPTTTSQPRKREKPGAWYSGPPLSEISRDMYAIEGEG